MELLAGDDLDELACPGIELCYRTPSWARLVGNEKVGADGGQRGRSPKVVLGALDNPDQLATAGVQLDDLVAARLAHEQVRAVDGQRAVQAAEGSCASGELARVMKGYDLAGSACRGIQSGEHNAVVWGQVGAESGTENPERAPVECQAAGTGEAVLRPVPDSRLGPAPAHKGAVGQAQDVNCVPQEVGHVEVVGIAGHC
jgi:hypothetical protein